MKTQHEIDTEHLIEALKLARERVTSGSVAEKQAMRDELKSAISCMYAYQEAGRDKPSSDDLRKLLRDPDDKATRDALAHWD